MYHKLVERLRDFFGISQKEARGALVMIVFCLLIIWMPFIFRRWVLPLFPTGSPPLDRQMLDSLAGELEKANQPKWKRSGKPGGRTAKIREVEIPVKLTDFNPNKASVESLMRLGIPAFIAKRIEKFRNKGGLFRRKEDLLEIYDFPANLYEKLESHIIIPEEHKPGYPGFAQKQESAEVKPFSKGNERNARPVVTSFDINQCDTTQLVRLRGIGSKLSVRILKFRDGLGGFHSAEQYNEIFGLDSLALSELRRYAHVMSAVRKIDINKATAAELGMHSYLKNRKLVSVLINYRDQHGPFQNIDDLRKIKVMDEVTLKKIEPYLTF